MAGAQYINYPQSLSEAEQQQLLVAWNATQAEYPQQQCIHHLFEAQVEQVPEAIAVLFADTKQHLTYRELNRRANQLAHFLRTQQKKCRPTIHHPFNKLELVHFSFH